MQEHGVHGGISALYAMTKLITNKASVIIADKRLIGQRTVSRMVEIIFAVLLVICIAFVLIADEDGEQE